MRCKNKPEEPPEMDLNTLATKLIESLDRQNATLDRIAAALEGGGATTAKGSTSAPEKHILVHTFWAVFPRLTLSVLTGVLTARSNKSSVTSDQVCVDARKLFFRGIVALN